MTTECQESESGDPKMERNIFLKLAIFPQLSRRYWLPRCSNNFSSDSEDSSSSVSSMSSSMSFISQHDPHQIMNSCEVNNYRSSR